MNDLNLKLKATAAQTSTENTAARPVQRGLRVLLVSDDFVPAITGVGSHLQTISQELQRLGCEVTVLTSRRRGEPAVEEWFGVQVHRVFSIKLFGFYQAIASRKRIAKIILERKIEVVHHHYLSFLLEQVLATSREFSIPQVYTYHMSDRLLTQPIFLRPFRHLIHARAKKIYNSFQVLISPSKAIADGLRRDGIKASIKIISNPVSLNLTFSPRIEFEKPSHFQILFAGRLAVEKNIQLLLHAFAELVKLQPGAQLVVAGDGPKRAELTNLASELGISNAVQFLGHLAASELSVQYARCDVFVLPSVLEVQAIVVLEAMRFGKPVILTRDIASATELVANEQNGYIVSSTKPEELASKLYFLSCNPEIVRKMGGHSLQMSEDFSVSNAVNSLLDVYTQNKNWEPK